MRRLAVDARNPSTAVLADGARVIASGGVTNMEDIRGLCAVEDEGVIGAITGRAVDGSGGLIPGVEVSITSPAMIGGARTAPTDESGSYRFTLLTPGAYRVSFSLPGFKTLNIEGVNVTAGATMTINNGIT